MQYPHRSPTHSTSPASTFADTTDSAASSTSTNTQPDLPGRHYRQAQIQLARNFLADVRERVDRFRFRYLVRDRNSIFTDAVFAAENIET